MSPQERKIVKTFKKARNVMVPTNMSGPPTPISQGDGNQSHPEHKKEVSSSLIVKETWQFDGRKIQFNKNYDNV